jgi:hypothetical protein
MNSIKLTFLIFVFILFMLSTVFSQGVMISNDPAAPAPAALLETLGLGTGEGNVLFTGQYKNTSPGQVPASGSGTRMFWHPDKVFITSG